MMSPVLQPACIIPVEADPDDAVDLAADAEERSEDSAAAAAPPPTALRELPPPPAEKSDEDSACFCTTSHSY